MSHRHQWTRAYKPAQPGDDPDRFYLWLRRGREWSELVQCACGAVGLVSAGYSTGGGHKVYLVRDPEQAEKWLREAGEWNAGA